jgi:hypothetical protein
MPVGKPAPPRPRSPDVGENAVAAERQRALKTLVAAMGAVVIDRARIDHAATCEGEASLPFQPWNFLGDATPQQMRAVRDHGIEHGGDVGGRHRAERDAAFCGGELDHRLQPVQAARTGADDFERDAALRRGRFEHKRNFIGADRNGTGIAGNENSKVHRCASATSASSRASSSRPTIRPSSIADGAVAHRPRQ